MFSCFWLESRFLVVEIPIRWCVVFPIVCWSTYHFLKLAWIFGNSQFSCRVSQSPDFLVDFSGPHDYFKTKNELEYIYIYIIYNISSTSSISSHCCPRTPPLVVYLVHHKTCLHPSTRDQVHWSSCRTSKIISQSRTSGGCIVFCGFAAVLGSKGLWEDEKYMGY